MNVTKWGIQIVLAGLLFVLACAQTPQITQENRRVVKMEIPSCV